MKLLKLLYLFLVLRPWHQATAIDSETIFQSLNSSHMKVWSREDTLKFESNTYQLHKMGLAWLPVFTSKSMEQPCQLEPFREALQFTSQPEAVLQEFWKNCEPIWRQDSFNFLTHSHEVLRSDFEPSKHPAVRVVHWLLPNNVKVRGLLFFKGPKSRPLVILRPGIFSHLKSTIAERFLMMQLFEDAPFHVLLLPSTSGADYIDDNHQFTFGGFDEGLQTWQILDYLYDKNEPLHQYITKIHLVGISLGAHGLWLTNLIEQTLRNERLGKTFLLCPAINLKQTYKAHRQMALSEFFVQAWFHLRLAPQRKELGVKDAETIASYIDKQIHDYQLPTVNWPLKDPVLPQVQNPFWTWNDYWKWMPKYDYNNTFILWNEADPVVPPAVNADLLMANPEVSQKVLLKLPRGLHCSLPASYQWPFVSLTIRGYLDKESLSVGSLAWQKSYPESSLISSVTLQQMELVEQQFKVEVLTRFKNPLLPPRIQIVRLPTLISDQSWVLSDFNETLKGSILRELSGRLKWSQDDHQWTLSFLALTKSE